MTTTATKRTHSVDFIVCTFVAMWALLLTGMPLSAVAERADGDQQAGTFTDSRDGRAYRTATIGHKVWMTENLAYKPAEGGCWAYDNDPSNATKYGYLYNFETARKVCPTGWHLPTTGELEQLMKSAGGTDATKAYSALTSDGNQGFSVLFGGFRNSDGKFKDLGKSAKFIYMSNPSMNFLASAKSPPYASL